MKISEYYRRKYAVPIALTVPGFMRSMIAKKARTENKLPAAILRDIVAAFFRYESYKIGGKVFVRKINTEEVDNGK